MQIQPGHTLRKFFRLFLTVAITGILFAHVQAATVSPKLQKQLTSLTANDSVGMAIVAFKTSNGLQSSHLDILRSVGITGGQTFQHLGMVAQPMTAGQVRALAANPNVRSIWSNDALTYYMNHARILGGVQRLQTDASFTFRNGGMPVSGKGDFSVLVIDSGVDATHLDLQYGTKVVQNVHPIVAAGTLEGFTPNVTVENVPNTDTTVGHGTHCAGIVGGTGARSGGNYPGVAPGVKIIGGGLGAGLFVLNAIGVWEWALANQYNYNIRVTTNSYGPSGGGEYSADHPFMIASFALYERNVTSLFAAGNDGIKDTLSPYAQAPWIIGVAAGSKDGRLAGFSSRGTPRSERLSDNNPANDNDAPTITAPGTGRAFETSLTRFGFTSAMVSTRSTSNLTANGLDADTEIPVGMIPFYTQISGTSMSTPYVAGVVALMLDADPTLTPDEIKQIITETATRMPGYEDYEVGAGYINAYAAVDKVFNRSRNYKSNWQEVSYNAQFGENREPQQAFHIDFNPAVSGATSTNAKTFEVVAGVNVLDVSAEVDTIADEGTGNLVGMRITSPSGTPYSTAIEYPVIGTNKRQIVVQNPEAGTWTVEIRGARGLVAAPQASSPVQAAAPGPVDGIVNQISYVLPVISDIGGHPQVAQIEAAIKNRVIDTYPDGTFRPDSVVTRADFARSLLSNTDVRQTTGAATKFGDVFGDLASIAEAVTANGTTLRGFNFTSKGLMSATGSSFNPDGTISRLDLAVALVRALGDDDRARSLANSNITVGGKTISDNAQIPSALRGYVQIAIEKGLLETYEAQVIQTAPGQFTVLPGPRVEPNNTITRATLATKLNSFHQLFITGN